MKFTRMLKITVVCWRKFTSFTVSFPCLLFLMFKDWN